MVMQKVAKEKINCLAAALFAIGMAIIAYFHYPHLWAGIATVVGITIVVRQFLLGRLVDMLVAIILFLAIFIVSYWELRENLVVPIILIIGGVYYIVSQISLYRSSSCCQSDKE